MRTTEKGGGGGLTKGGEGGSREDRNRHGRLNRGGRWNRTGLLLAVYI